MKLLRLLKEICTYPKEHPFRFGGMILIGVASLTPIIILKRTFWIPHESRLPASVAIPVLPERQTESSTCGFHAMSTIYRAYGLNPEQEAIRERLGVDIKALFWMGDSTGSLHPDVYMVFRQDGFDIESVALDNSDSHQVLLEHLYAGRMLMLLIQRRENGNLHWVVVQGTQDDRYIVLDSLKKDPVLEDAEFTHHFVLTALVVRPGQTLRTGAVSSLLHFVSGTRELSRFETRRKQLKAGPVSWE